MICAHRRMTPQEVLNEPWVHPDGIATDVPIQFEVVNRLQVRWSSCDVHVGPCNVLTRGSFVRWFHI